MRGKKGGVCGGKRRVPIGLFVVIRTRSRSDACRMAAPPLRLMDMKGLFCLAAAAIFLTGCFFDNGGRVAARPVPAEGPRYADAGEVEKLRNEARENFAKLKAESGGPSSSVVPVGSGGLRQPARPEAPYRYNDRNNESTETVYAPPPNGERGGLRSENAIERDRELSDRRSDAQQRQMNYRAFEAGYARQLGKKPSQLTPEERAWVRDNFE
jgi:hypothetical protein